MTSPRDQLLFDTFVTAMEGGIGYWSYCEKYHWMFPVAQPAEVDMSAVKEMGLAALVVAAVSRYGEDDVLGFYAEIVEEEEDKKHRIDRTVMERGLKLAATTWRDKLHWSDGKPPLVVTEDTDWVPDAGDADMVVQLGLFGDVIYG